MKGEPERPRIMMNSERTSFNNRPGRWEGRSATNPSASPAHPSGFTLIELLVVIGIIALLASLVVGLTAHAARKMRESRIRGELEQIATAIDAYHAQFNQYPPDNVVSRDPLVVNPVTNSLYYELTGVIVDDKGNRFRSPNRQQWIGASTVSSLFNADGFVHADANPKEIKSFLPSLTSAQHKLILKSPVDVEVLAVAVDWPLNNPLFPPPFNFSSPDPNVKRINPVRYVASPHATNNPATFDLWAEYVEGKKVKIICNWSKDILEK